MRLISILALALGAPLARAVTIDAVYFGQTHLLKATVSAGTLALADNAQLRFVIGATSGTNNRITGAGTVTLDGDFNIDPDLTDASPLTSPLVDPRRYGRSNRNLRLFVCHHRSRMVGNFQCLDQNRWRQYIYLHRNHRHPDAGPLRLLCLLDRRLLPR